MKHLPRKWFDSIAINKFSRLQGVLVLAAFIILIAISLRFLSIQRGEVAAVRIMSKELLERSVSVAGLQARSLNYLRGDYEVFLKRPPFQAIHWTVNILSGQIISWQSQKKEDSILKSPL